MFVRNGYLYIIRMMCITRLNIECRYHFVIGHDSIFTFRHSLSPDSLCYDGLSERFSMQKLSSSVPLRVIG